MRRLTLLTATVLLLLAGCTSGDGPDETDAPSTATSETPGSTSGAPAPQATAEPDCADIWKAGETLPDDYTNCLDGGEPAEPDVVACTDGGSLVVHLDTFYAVTGGTIVEPDVAPLQDTDEFGEAYATCTGE